MIPVKPATHTVRVMLPFHLRTLAKLADEAQVEVVAPVTQTSIVEAIEARYPVLRGTIREHGSLRRRPWLRFFACGEDLTHDATEEALPEKIVNGSEPFLIVGAIAGG